MRTRLYYKSTPDYLGARSACSRPLNRGLLNPKSQTINHKAHAVKPKPNPLSSEYGTYKTVTRFYSWLSGTTPESLQSVPSLLLRGTEGRVDYVELRESTPVRKFVNRKTPTPYPDDGYGGGVHEGETRQKYCT